MCSIYKAGDAWDRPYKAICVDGVTVASQSPKLIVLVQIEVDAPCQCGDCGQHVPLKSARNWFDPSRWHSSNGSFENMEMIRIGKGSVLKTGARKRCRFESVPSPKFLSADAEREILRAL